MTRGKKGAQSANRRLAERDAEIAGLRGELRRLRAAMLEATSAHQAEIMHIRQDHLVQVEHLVEERFDAEVERRIAEEVEERWREREMDLRREFAGIVREWGEQTEVQASLDRWGDLASALGLQASGDAHLIVQKPDQGNRHARRTNVSKIRELAQLRRMGADTSESWRGIR